jgi:leucyl-tRNA synthetase
MSKRWGNVVTPDEIIPKFGADTLRVYEMFMGPFDVMKPWSITGVEGSFRFLGKVWRLLNEKPKEEVDPKVLSKLHQTIKKVTSDIEGYKFNTAISALMELTNTIVELGADRETYKTLTLLIAPFAPHMAEEIWVSVLGEPFSVHKASWPKYDAKYIKEDHVKVVVQVNGKLRGTIDLELDLAANENKVTELVKADENISKWIAGAKVKKVFFVPGKIINFVI